MGWISLGGSGTTINLKGGVEWEIVLVRLEWLGVVGLRETMG